MVLLLLLSSNNFGNFSFAFHLCRWQKCFWHFLFAPGTIFQFSTVVEVFPPRFVVVLNFFSPIAAGGLMYMYLLAQHQYRGDFTRKTKYITSFQKGTTFSFHHMEIVLVFLLLLIECIFLFARFFYNPLAVRKKQSTTNTHRQKSCFSIYLFVAFCFILFQGVFLLLMVVVGVYLCIFIAVRER